MNTSSASMRTPQLIRLAAALVLISLSLSEVNAYTQRASPAFMSRIMTRSALFAWSIPSSTFLAPSFSAPSFGGSWYNELNPTARRTVYDDAPLEYTFVIPGDDWPSSFDSPRKNQPKRMRINPLRRAAKWVRGGKNQSQ